LAAEGTIIVEGGKLLEMFWHKSGRVAKRRKRTSHNIAENKEIVLLCGTWL